MKNLFIDTNILLSFYHLSSDDLEELKKLILLIENNDICLYMPRQVIQEFKRNRDTKIADALKNVKEEKISKAFPQFFKEYPEFEDLKKIQKQYLDTKKKLIDSLQKDIKEKSLKADEIIDGLFSVAEIIEFTDDIVTKGKLRFDLGNPPGKNNSYGDAINWESLVMNVNQFEDLYFISGDKDYYSTIDINDFNRFLKEEWEEEKKSSIIHFKKLSEFFKQEYPDIKLARELEKDLLVQNLINSNSFYQTRKILEKLVSFSPELSKIQIFEITKASTENNQIIWIAKDGDIADMLNELILPWRQDIPTHLFYHFMELYNDGPSLDERMQYHYAANEDENEDLSDDPRMK
ncbi:PIN domain-containing protein [Labilibaculum antarcticum]|uniref:DUF4935 domain-containing protein n=1 Tax=Labilibaculum antarcticum TaxID=1717717 RepID=A0A1Y1CRW4_9BACT|nr:PIN domain-containing protein [Labilibaculum antarcticum]BAX81981.1 hypothetical protein ALGA_3689 [Labilibaculum antarcticum]